MSEQTEIPGYDPDSFDHAAYHGFRPAPGATRHEGWSPDKQQQFLAALAEGITVAQACGIVGLSRQSAYALRESPRGAGFALGWEAAVLLSRNALADELMERALRGTRETVSDDKGRVVTRHKYDNRLAMAMLNRLDKMAANKEADHAAARLIAADFGQYLELIGRDDGPARAGLFLGARVKAASEDELAPIRALARADKWLRTHTDLADGVSVADLDPAQRASWTAEQWNRAEAAGLVALAPEPAETRVSCQPCQPALDAVEPLEWLDDNQYASVWWDDIAEEWRTSFPPPEGFEGDVYGVYGDDEYDRALTPEECAIVEAAEERGRNQIDAADCAERDAWFAARAAKAARAEPEMADETAG